MGCGTPSAPRVAGQLHAPRRSEMIPPKKGRMVLGMEYTWGGRARGGVTHWLTCAAAHTRRRTLYSKL